MRLSLQSSGQLVIMHFFGSIFGLMNGFREDVRLMTAPTGQSLLHQKRLSLRLTRRAITGNISSSMKKGLITLVMNVVALRWNSPLVDIPMGQIRQNALKPKTEEATREPASIPVVATPFLVMRRVTGHDKHDEFDVALFTSMFRSAILIRFASIFGRNLWMNRSKLSTKVPMGHAQLQNIEPTRIMITRTMIRAIIVSIRREMSTFVVIKACNAPRGSTSHAPGDGLLHP